MKSDFLKDSLHKMPAVKRLAKRILKAPIDKQKRTSIATYHAWLAAIEPTSKDLSEQHKESSLFSYQPLISVVTPVYNTPAEYFKEMVESVRNQSYENWELVLVDDASPEPEVRDLIKFYAETDKRIKYKFLEKGLHIAGATNEAIKLANGEFVSLFDHDDVLRPNALFEIVAALNKNKSLNFIYTDEDKIIDGVSLRADPFFKPDWNQDFLYSVNYITHFTTIRKKLIEKVGYENGEFNGAQDWEFYLRITRNIEKNTIHHIPVVLYSWRVHPQSTAMSLDAKPYVIEAQKKAIVEDLYTKEIKSFDLMQDERYSAQWKLVFQPPSITKISIVPTGELARDPRIEQKVKKRLTDVNYELLSISNINQASGDFIVFLPVLPRDMNSLLGNMSGDACRTDIGFVASEATGRAQVIGNLRTILTENISDFIQSVPDSLTYHYYRTARYNLAEVSEGQVLIIQKEKLNQVLGSNSEANSVAEIGHTLSGAGYRHLYNPYAKV